MAEASSSAVSTKPSLKYTLTCWPETRADVLFVQVADIVADDGPQVRPPTTSVGAATVAVEMLVDTVPESAKVAWA